MAPHRSPPKTFIKPLRHDLQPLQLQLSACKFTLRVSKNRLGGGGGGKGCPRHAGQKTKSKHQATLAGSSDSAETQGSVPLFKARKAVGGSAVLALKGKKAQPNDEPLKSTWQSVKTTQALISKAPRLARASHAGFHLESLLRVGVSYQRSTCPDTSCFCSILLPLVSWRCSSLFPVMRKILGIFDNANECLSGV